jgi:acyl-CoA dehydrogenase
MEAMLEVLLRGDPIAAPILSLGAWRERLRLVTAGFDDTADRALVAGFSADRLGYAFAGAYQAALVRLVPALDRDEPVCLCATEAGGAQPRAISTRLEPRPGGAVLTGEKSFVTLADEARVLLVVASEGVDESGRNRLRLVRVRAGAPGVSVRGKAPTPFAPEIPHASVVFEEVAVAPDDVMPGDGYTRYLKPFRTIEDIHVLAAVTGFLVAVARASGWPRPIVERGMSCAVGLRGLGAADPTKPETHVALAGAFAGARALLAEVEPLWPTAPEETHRRWQRDRLLLEVAGGVRARRTDAAWRALVG